MTLEDGSHSYVMLANSEGESVMAKDSARGLSTSTCLRFICRNARDRRQAINVIFGGSYDANMVLHSLPRSKVEQIRYTGKTRYKEWRIDYRERKYLRVKEGDKPSVTLWDVIGFFQCKFTTAIERYLGSDYPDLPMIRENKDARATFQFSDRDSILRYCNAELRALVTIMGQFRDDIDHAGIRLSRWDGPGAIASHFYRSNQTRNHMRRMLPEFQAINRAAQSAYSGGRIEAIKFGNRPRETYEYDIRSAYPDAIARLPSLERGDWKHYDCDPGNRYFALYRVRYSGVDKVGDPYIHPLFYRSKLGNILYPVVAHGWYWSPEMEALRNYRPGTFTVEEAFVLDSGETAVRPFAFVPALYEQRKLWKQQGNGAERALKLALNSLYGKMVQQVGWEAHGIPPYHQLEWGGWVTSYTRAKLYAASQLVSESVIAFETDALFSEVPIVLDIGEGLGQWEERKHASLTYLQPGIYWGEGSVKFRGIDPGTLTKDSVLEGWSNLTDSTGESDPKPKVQTTRFRAIGTSLVGDRYEDWCKWITEEREISLVPGKDSKRTHSLPAECPSCSGQSVYGNRERSTYRFGLAAMHTTTATSQGRDYLDTLSFPYPLSWLGESNSHIERNRKDSELEREFGWLDA